MYKKHFDGSPSTIWKKYRVLLDNNYFSKNKKCDRLSFRDQCCHLELMEPQWNIFFSQTLLSRSSQSLKKIKISIHRSTRRCVKSGRGCERQKRPNLMTPKSSSSLSSMSKAKSWENTSYVESLNGLQTHARTLNNVDPKTLWNELIYVFFFNLSKFNNDQNFYTLWYEIGINIRLKDSLFVLCNGSTLKGTQKQAAARTRPTKNGSWQNERCHALARLPSYRPKCF